MGDQLHLAKLWAIREHADTEEVEERQAKTQTVTRRWSKSEMKKLIDGSKALSLDRFADSLGRISGGKWYRKTRTIDLSTAGAGGISRTPSQPHPGLPLRTSNTKTPLPCMPSKKRQKS